MTDNLILDRGHEKSDYSLDPRPDRKLRFIADRLAHTASQEGCSYIARILSHASSRYALTLNGLRETLADVRSELDNVQTYEPKPATEAAFALAWNDMEELAS